jgi:hypothetical protein
MVIIVTKQILKRKKRMRKLSEITEASRFGELVSEEEMRAKTSWETIRRAQDKAPDEWLGPDNIPGNPEIKKRAELACKLIEKSREYAKSKENRKL